MKFNIVKCKVLHIGNNNQYTNNYYTMNGSELSKVNHEKDLGVTIKNDLKPCKHCSDVVKKVNELRVFIGKTFANKSEKLSLHYLNAPECTHLVTLL